MIISTRGRYALRMMVDLAENKSDAWSSLKEISERQNISKKYLEQIIPILNKAEFLDTLRGVHGGYRLHRVPSEYTVGEILRAAEGTLVPVSCMEGDVNTCERCQECATLPIWQGLDKVVNDYLDRITLQDVVDGHPFDVSALKK